MYREQKYLYYNLVEIILTEKLTQYFKITLTESKDNMLEVNKF